MSEAVQLAKVAREKLASALNALQSADDAPDQLLEAAEPIAQAMSVLHRIERSNGADLEGRDKALAGVRAALERLQKVEESHPAVDLVMEAVAASLAKVHALVRFTPPAAEPAPVPLVTAKPLQPLPPLQPQVYAATQPIPIPPDEPARPVGPRGTLPIQARPIAEPQYQAPPPAYQPPPQQPAYQAPPQPAYQAPQPAYQPPQPAYQAPQPAYQAPQAPPQPAYQAPQAYSAPEPEPVRQQAQVDQPAAGLYRSAPATPTIDVELGTHSVSNFYKGLGGNDVIEHGGIFVATYKVPKIGAVVNLRLLLPGDYEFQANAVVQWTREASSGEPGFGARFTQIAQDGRQLVYRYTRNREPLFYDDL